ncbi:hypothetical protein Fmac_006591 [Flemingia macrophylla]|uniref:Dof zinc finger protein n=1 Tax=Flemingia macrophylla TaxID=520843 RepID=A0ABD1NB16_9FABA
MMLPRALLPQSPSSPPISACHVWCGSSNTKFCYYNNYSLTQPRYFCKGCRRYWTKGGSLRNVPIGGGCRKSRRGKYNKTSRQVNNSVVHSDDLGRASSSSLVSDGPNIDLAQVYASFLNQKPAQVQTAGCYPSPEYSSMLNTDFALSKELGLTECFQFHEQSRQSHLGESIQMYLCRFNSIQKHQEYSSSYDTTTNTNFELPPLPGDDMLWSNSEMMVDHALQATQTPLFGPEIHDEDFLLGNSWSHFDLQRDASFPTP